jgi:hypothetical protein
MIQKPMKKILILIIVAMSAVSCTKDKSEYYINQERDPDVVGVWASETSDNFILCIKLTIDGKMYSYTHSPADGNIDYNNINWGHSYKYWYSKDIYI